MSDEYRYWHFKVAEAYSVNDIDGARRCCLEAAPIAFLFDPDLPQDHALRLVVAQHDDNREWLAEAEASLARNRGRWAPGSVAHEASLAAHHLCGTMRLSEPARAAAHFSAALELAPDFLPARVELELLRTGRDRGGTFTSLGSEPPRQDWRYVLAASELGMTLAPRGPPQQLAAAICLRGFCTPETPALVRLYRALNPQARIFVATWETTPADIVESLRKSAGVILIADTANPGVQNRNRQILLANAVLQAARREMFAYALLTRTDVALFQPDILSNLLALHRGFPVKPGRMLGRLVAPDIFTRRFMPFHISDILSFGALPDLFLQWGAPLAEANENISTEQYLHWHLYGALGLPPVDPDLRSYRPFLRDYFIIRDFDWFGGLWLKHPTFRNGAALKLRDSCVSQSDWERLYYAPEPMPHLDLMGALPPRGDAAVGARPLEVRLTGSDAGRRPHALPVLREAAPSWTNDRLSRPAQAGGLAHQIVRALDDHLHRRSGRQRLDLALIVGDLLQEARKLEVLRRSFPGGMFQEIRDPFESRFEGLFVGDHCETLQTAPIGAPIFHHKR